MEPLEIQNKLMEIEQELCETEKTFVEIIFITRKENHSPDNNWKIIKFEMPLIESN